MSRSLRRGAVAAVIAVAIAPVLAACSAGSSAATLEVKPNSAATSITAAGGQLKLNGVAVVADANGNAPASIIASIANNEQQAENLVSVTVGTSAATLTGPTAIRPGAALSLGTPGKDATLAITQTLDQPAGATIPVTFVFANAGSVTLTAQIQVGTGEYRPYAPATPTPTPTTLPSLLPSGAALPGASGSASPHETKKAGETKKASAPASAPAGGATSSSTP